MTDNVRTLATEQLATRDRDWFLLNMQGEGRNPNSIGVFMNRFNLNRQEARMSARDETLKYVPFGFANDVNYMNINRVGGHALGLNRLVLFAEHVEKSIFFRMLPRNTRVFFHATYLDLSVIRDGYAQAAAVNFGSTRDDGFTERRGPSEFGFDLRNPYVPVGKQGVITKTSNVVHRGSLSETEFVEELVGGILDTILRGSDSGKGDLLRFFNIFVVMYIPPRGRALVELQNPACTALKALEKRMVIINPNVRDACFWFCLAWFMARDHSNGQSRLSEGTWYNDLIVRHCSANVYWKRVARNVHLELCEGFSNEKQRVNPMLEVEFGEIDDIMEFFGFAKEDYALVDVEGSELIKHGEKDMAKRWVFCWLENHYVVVRSYTALVYVKECKICKARFRSRGDFVKHNAEAKCLECRCGYTARNLEDWEAHQLQMMQNCSWRNGEMKAAMEASEKYRERKYKRFPHDKSSKEWREIREGRGVEEVLDLNSNLSYEGDCIYFDLETIVPMNTGDEIQMQQQIPYACGWIRNSEMGSGNDEEKVTITYGPNCMKEFVEYLDDLYGRFQEELEAHIFAESMRDLRVCRVPKRVGRKRVKNRAWKVKASWNCMRQESEGKCPECGECPGDLEGHGYVIQGQDYFFSTCAMNHYVKMSAGNDMARNLSGKAPRVSVYAHNGGRFDWLFFHRYLINEGKMNLVKTIRGDSKYYRLMYRNVFELRDSFLFLTSSLDKLTKDFKIGMEKGHFPYEFMSDMGRIHERLEGEERVRNMIPRHLFEKRVMIGGEMKMEVKRSFTEEEYVEMMSEKGWIYDICEETVKYLRKDVICLGLIMRKFQSAWKSLPCGPELFDYDTIGQMCHTYFLNNFIDEDSYPQLGSAEDEYIRRALYGGRTEVFQRFCAPTEKIHYVDVNSLYPYVMESCDLPGGDPTWYVQEDDPLKEKLSMDLDRMPKMKVVTQTQLNLLLGYLNGEHAASIYGFMEVDVLPPKDLMYPVLPERRKGGKTKEMKNMFSLHPKERAVYYTEELKLAIDNGYMVTRVYSYVEWKRKRHYGKLIELLKEQKMLGEGKDKHGNPIPGMEKNPSLRAAAKIAQNSLFGKTIQKVTSSVRLVDNQIDLWEMVKDPSNNVSILPILRTDHGDVVEVRTNQFSPGIQKKACAAVGTAILAEARMVLYSYFKEVMKVGGTIMYCDTDSIIFSGENKLPPECMHDAVYGKMKEEVDPEKIVRGGYVGLSPKCYALKLVDGSPYVKCKGVSVASNYVMEQNDEITWSDLYDLMLEEEDESVHERSLIGLNFEYLEKLVRGQVDELSMNQMCFVKSKTREVAAVRMTKIIMDKFDKRRVYTRGKTFAWTEWNEDDKKLIDDAEQLSNFLNEGNVEEIAEWVMEHKEERRVRSVVEGWLTSDSFNAVYFSDRCRLDGPSFFRW